MLRKALLKIILLMIVFWMFLSIPVLAENRLAFTVGIDKYDHLPKYRQLTRSVNDAKAISKLLNETLNFEVYGEVDLRRARFNELWQDFIFKVNEGDEIVIFLSGHGVEIEGQNYFLPRSIPHIKFGRQKQIKRESISISEMLLDIGDKKPRTTLLIIDACRENPLIPPEYKSLKDFQGLAKMDAPDGVFILYSAAAKESALDRLPGKDPIKNSVYMRKLLPLLKRPNLSIQRLAKLVQEDVYYLAKSINHKQKPVYYDGILGTYCLNGCEEEDPSTPQIGKKLNRGSSREALASLPPRKLPKPSRGKKCPDKMAFIPGGVFMAGEVDSLKEMSINEFCMDKYEVTQAEYKLVIGDDPSYFKRANHPVVNVFWHQAKLYCEKVGKRLPTEWEWEKAAKAGTSTKYYWGNELDEAYAWFSYGNTGHQPVGEKKPNEFDLYDMSGNVSEWTSDWYSDEKESRVLRGGSGNLNPEGVRSAFRGNSQPTYRFNDIGFRCAQ